MLTQELSPVVCILVTGERDRHAAQRVSDVPPGSTLQTHHLSAASQNSHCLRINPIRTNMMIIKWLDYLLCETENELTTVAADTGSRTKKTHTRV